MYVGMNRKSTGGEVQMENVALVIMDGIGIGPHGDANMVSRAYTPTLDRLMRQYPACQLAACGTAVGLPGDLGR